MCFSSSIMSGASTVGRAGWQMCIFLKTFRIRGVGLCDNK